MVGGMKEKRGQRNNEGRVYKNREGTCQWSSGEQIQVSMPLYKTSRQPAAIHKHRTGCTESIKPFTLAQYTMQASCWTYLLRLLAASGKTFLNTSAEHAMQLSQLIANNLVICFLLLTPVLIKRKRQVCMRGERETERGWHYKLGPSTSTLACNGCNKLDPLRKQVHVPLVTLWSLKDVQLCLQLSRIIPENPRTVHCTTV